MEVTPINVVLFVVYQLLKLWVVTVGLRHDLFIESREMGVQGEKIADDHGLTHQSFIPARVAHINLFTEAGVSP